jgi:hypothetical protein
LTRLAFRRGLSDSDLTADGLVRVIAFSLIGDIALADHVAFLIDAVPMPKGLGYDQLVCHCGHTS